MCAQFNDNVQHTPVHHMSSMLCRKRSSFDLSQEKLKMRTVLDIVKIVTAEGLKCLCGFFGSSIGVGMRKKFHLLMIHQKTVVLVTK